MQTMAASTRIAPIIRAEAEQNMQASETVPALLDSGINAGFIPKFPSTFPNGYGICTGGISALIAQ